MNDGFTRRSKMSAYSSMRRPGRGSARLRDHSGVDLADDLLPQSGEEMLEMPGFHVFYCRHRTGDGIASHAPAPMPRDRIAALASHVLEENGDFLGLVDDSESVLQFIYLARGDDDSRPIRMDIPDVARKRSLIRHISDIELARLLENLPDRLTTDVIMKVDIDAG